MPAIEEFPDVAETSAVHEFPEIEEFPDTDAAAAGGAESVSPPAADPISYGNRLKSDLYSGDPVRVVHAYAQLVNQFRNTWNAIGAGAAEDLRKKQPPEEFPDPTAAQTHFDSSRLGADEAALLNWQDSLRGYNPAALNPPTNPPGGALIEATETPLDKVWRIVRESKAGRKVFGDLGSSGDDFQQRGIPATLASIPARPFVGAGKGAQAIVADVAELEQGNPTLENVRAASRGEALPVLDKIASAALEEHERGEFGVPSLLAHISLGLADLAPKLLAMQGGPAMTGIVFGTREDNSFDPSAGAMGLLLPVVGQETRVVVSDAVNAGVKRGATWLAQPAVEKTLQVAANQAAMDGVMALQQSPELLELAESDPREFKRRVAELVGSNLAFAVPEIMRKTPTEEVFEGEPQNPTEVEPLRRRDAEMMQYLIGQPQETRDVRFKQDENIASPKEMVDADKDRVGYFGIQEFPAESSPVETASSSNLGLIQTPSAETAIPAAPETSVVPESGTLQAIAEQKPVTAQRVARVEASKPYTVEQALKDLPSVVQELKAALEANRLKPPEVSSQLPVVSSQPIQPARGDARPTTAIKPAERSLEYTLLDAVKDNGGLGGPDLETAMREMAAGKTAAQVARSYGGEYDALADVLETIFVARRGKKNNNAANQLAKAYELAGFGGNRKGIDQALLGMESAHQEGRGVAGGLPADHGDLIGRAWEAAQTRAKGGRELPQSAEGKAELFWQTATEPQNKVGLKKIDIAELKVGDTFRLKGKGLSHEPLEVRFVDPQTGEVQVKDGPTFGTQDLPPGTEIYVQGLERGGAEASFAAGDEFSFDAPESVAEQKARLAAEKRKADEAKAKEQMLQRAGQKLTGKDLDTTTEMFGGETRVDKAGQGSLFSKGDVPSTGLDVGAGKRMAEYLRKSFPNTLPVEVVATEADLPASVKTRAQALGVTGVKGVVTAGKVYLVARNLADVREAGRIWLHEQAGHFATDKVLGPKLQSFAAGVEKSFRDTELMADIRRRYPGADAVTLGREYMAKLAENPAADPGAWRKIVARVRDWLRSLGFKLDVSENDVREVLRRAMNSLKATDEHGRTRREKGEDLKKGSFQAKNALILAPGFQADFALTAHHGTPHKVDKFTTAKIGTGEGAQVYGWGLYFAENPKVAEEYAKNVKDWNKVDGINTKLGDLSREMDAIRNAGGSWNKGYEARGEELRSEYDRLMSDKLTGSGRKYTVSINAEPEELLNWDKPLSEQSEKVKAAAGKYFDAFVDESVRQAKEAGVQFPNRQYFYDNTMPTVFYDWLAKERYMAGSQHPEWMAGMGINSARVASETLASLGIKGIRFLDQGSRQYVVEKEYSQDPRSAWVVAGIDGKIIFKDADRAKAQAFADSKQTRNYVVFKDADINITHENGQPVAMSEAMEGSPMFAAGEHADKIADLRRPVQELEDKVRAAVKLKVHPEERRAAGLSKQQAENQANVATAEFRRAQDALRENPAYLEAIMRRQNEIMSELKAARGEARPTDDIALQRKADLEGEFETLQAELEAAPKKMVAAVHARHFMTGEEKTPREERAGAEAPGTARGDARPTEASGAEIAAETPAARRKKVLKELPERTREVFQAAGKTKDKLTNLWTARENRDVIAYTFDAAENGGNLFGKQAANEVLHALNRSFGATGERVTARNPVREQALTFVIESGLQEGELNGFEEQIRGSAFAGTRAGKDALAAIRFAQTHLERLKPVAELYSKITDAQVEHENLAGVETLHRKGGYVFHMEDVAADQALPDYGAGGSGVATPFLKVRQYATYAEAVANGSKPKSMNAVDLLQKRLSLGQKKINHGAWVDGMRRMMDPASQLPLVTELQTHVRADGKEYEDAPPGYTVANYAGQKFAILKGGYDTLLKSLTTPSTIRDSVLGNIGMELAGGIKHGMLVFDSYHLGRLAFWNSMVRGMGFPGNPAAYKRGLTLLDQTMPEIKRMVEAGEIPAKLGADLIESKRQLNLLVSKGLNVGGAADNIATHFVQHLPIAGRFNKFLFQEFQRGATAEASLIELRRQQKMFPNVPEEVLARRVAADLNKRFGNLQNQSWIKNKNVADALRMLFLAPQWNESLIRSEIGAVKELGQAVPDSVRNRRLAIGLLGRSVFTAAIGTFLANQVINYITRGKPTWDNEEESEVAKISAWIPDVVGNGPGYFLNPLTLPAEISELLMKKAERSGDLTKAIEEATASRLGPLGRFAYTFKDRKDRSGQPVEGWGLVAQAASNLIPVPISGGTIAAAAKQMVTGEPEENYPGQFQRQAFQTFGAKLDSAPTPEQRMQALAREFNRAKGLPPGPEGYHRPYYALDTALRMGNKNKTKAALDDLLLKYTPKQISARFKDRASDPFTGQKAREVEFLRTLNQEQRQAYEAARQQRRLLRDKVNALLSSAGSQGQ